MSEHNGRQARRGSGPRTRPADRGHVKLLVGRIVSVLGILAGVGGTVAALAVDSTDITAAAAATLLGVLGYFLGARRLGAVSVVVGVVLLLVLAGASSGFSQGR